MREGIIISLGGVKGSGKDTVGTEISQGWDFVLEAFARPIKAMAQIAFPQLTSEQLFGSSAAREEMIDIPLRGLDPRDGSRLIESGIGFVGKDGRRFPGRINARIVCQTLGTEWGRRLHKNIWVDAVLHPLVLTKTAAVITDQRFLNEVEGVKAAGGVTVRLLRRFEEMREEAEAGRLHPSEAELFSIPDHYYDYELDNRCELEDLPKLVGYLMEEILGKNAAWRQRAFDSKPHPPLRIGL